MPTGVIAGLNPVRSISSGVANGGLTEYDIASAYGTALGIGDPVKLSSTGTLERATNDTDDAIGIFQGVQYTDAEGKRQFKKVWTAGTVAADAKALVSDDPRTIFLAKADAAISGVNVGDIYALNLTNPDTATGRSTATVDVASTVAASLGLVKVVKVVDVDNLLLEVILVDHALRDDG